MRRPHFIHEAALIQEHSFAKEIEETTAPASTPASAKPAKIANGADNSDDDGDFDGEVDDDVPEGEDPFATGDAGEEEVEQKSRATIANDAQAWLKEDRDYEYIEVRSWVYASLRNQTDIAQLLGHFYAALYASHPGLSGGGGRKAVKIPPPSMHRDGNKRSVFANVSEICRRMKRQPEHVIQFLFAELGTTGSVDGSSRLIMCVCPSAPVSRSALDLVHSKGRFQQKQIESVLRRYIGAFASVPLQMSVLTPRAVEYVTCKTCKSPDTLLAKENRLYFVTCQSCVRLAFLAGLIAHAKAQLRLSPFGLGDSSRFQGSDRKATGSGGAPALLLRSYLC